MRLYTIGFTKKSAKEFFELLKKNNVRTLLDIRLNNSSQLAGFTKGRDLEYFLMEMAGIKYIHDVDFSPTKQILNDYKKKIITWGEYEKLFEKLILKRNIKDKVNKYFNGNLDGVCLLCSEATSENCHRRLIAEYLKNSFDYIEIIHL
ncbi:DUF488 domain-containing protein [Paramaledivibacter caminithermalis]|jgi:uncharacterized protein (DUF488 family)|uniref:DUF488 domain-containing protein n=1 Tax=Paramaledivibacter caminithermalis (strain DSM 15212 / CIP 107654 / DViRD3) TaxID=1121301 RepID=A0A1M6M960_PARC5|nr:DUF488 domain-containing protein [Paramaledivibacter caminithermalis]SHJ79964.1 Protein of unknown function, DUF488 [Paramaledivibacter caminithermalis DSM 15212]